MEKNKGPNNNIIKNKENKRIKKITDKYLSELSELENSSDTKKVSKNMFNPVIKGISQLDEINRLRKQQVLIDNHKKQLKKLDKGFYITKPKDKVSFNISLFQKENIKLIHFEKVFHGINHNDLLDHYDINSNKIYSTQNSLSLGYLNGLLIGDHIRDNISLNPNNIGTKVGADIGVGVGTGFGTDTGTTQLNKNKSQLSLLEISVNNSISDSNIPKDPDDIWKMLNDLDNENDVQSDNLDSITSNSENGDDKHAKNRKKCKGCGLFDTLKEDLYNSVIVCSKCGIVNDEILDYGPEWRQYNNDDSRNENVSRCGCPSNYFFPKSSQGTIMVGSSSNRLKRKQKWCTMVYKERSLNLVFEYISQICSKNKIPKIIVDSAKTLYKKISDCKHKSGDNIGKQIIIRGDKRLSIIAACVFKACEMNKNPRNTKEIANFFNLDEKKVTKGLKNFSKILRNADDSVTIFNQFNSNTTEDYIRRHCPKLKINKENTDLTVKIAKNCCRIKLASNHNPQSISAGSILAMVEYKRLSVDKKDIASLFGTSELTIGKIYDKIAPYINALVDDDTTNHLIKKFKING